MIRRSPPERADFYDASHAVYFGDHAARYEFAAHFVCDKRVIDAACGSGYGSARLKQAGEAACVIDLDYGSIRRNQLLYQGIKFVHANCEKSDVAEYGPEVVVSFETIEHNKKPSRFRIRFALGEDGLFIVSCPNDEELGENPYHLHSWALSQFRIMLEEYFENVVILGQVETPVARVHREFGRYLDDQMGVLCNQPWTHAWRTLRAFLRRPPDSPRPAWTVSFPGLVTGGSSPMRAIKRRCYWELASSLASPRAINSASMVDPLQGLSLPPRAASTSKLNRLPRFAEPGLSDAS